MDMSQFGSLKNKTNKQTKPEKPLAGLTKRKRDSITKIWNEIETSP